MQMTFSNCCKQKQLEEAYFKNLWRLLENDSYLKALELYNLQMNLV
jgi:hypothetical protein